MDLLCRVSSCSASRITDARCWALVQARTWGSTLSNTGWSGKASDTSKNWHPLTRARKSIYTSFNSISFNLSYDRTAILECRITFAGLPWHCQKTNRLVNNPQTPGNGRLYWTVAICWWHMAHVQQCLVVQPKNFPCLQVLHEAQRNFWARNRSCHAGAWLLLWQKSEFNCENVHRVVHLWRFCWRMERLVVCLKLEVPKKNCSSTYLCPTCVGPGVFHCVGIFCNLPGYWGRRYCFYLQLEFMPMTLCCYGKALCTISTGAVYYEYQNRWVVWLFWFGTSL